MNILTLLVERRPPRSFLPPPPTTAAASQGSTERTPLQSKKDREQFSTKASARSGAVQGLSSRTFHHLLVSKCHHASGNPLAAAVVQSGWSGEKYGEIGDGIQ